MIKLILIFVIGAIISFAAVRYGPTWLGWDAEQSQDASRNALIWRKSDPGEMFPQIIG